MGLQVFLNFGFHPFGPVSCYLVSSPSRYLQVDQVSIHLCLHTFRRLSFLHFSVWDVSQALTQPFACFPLSLHCFSGLTSGLGAVFVQPSAGAVCRGNPLDLLGLQSGSPSGRSCLPNTTRHLCGRITHLRGTVKLLCSRGVVLIR